MYSRFRDSLAASSGGAILMTTLTGELTSELATAQCEMADYFAGPMTPSLGKTSALKTVDWYTPS